MGARSAPPPAPPIAPHVEYSPRGVMIILKALHDVMSCPFRTAPTASPRGLIARGGALPRSARRCTHVAPHAPGAPTPRARGVIVALLTPPIMERLCIELHYTHHAAAHAGACARGS